MNMIHLADVLYAVLVILLLISCITDWRERIIPHWLNISIALLAPVLWWAMGLHLWPNVAIQIGLCIVITAIFGLCQAMGMMGGGDVKMLGALALWFNWQAMLTLLFYMSVIGGVLTIFMLIYHKMRKLEGKPEIPYGIAIAFAALILICKHYLNHFR